MPSLPALVADAGFGSSVAGIRALGAGGVEVGALGPDRLAAGRWSRWTQWRAVAPDPAADPAGFVALVAELGRRRGPFVAYCGAEPSVGALAARADVLGTGVRLPFPAGPGLERVRDKVALARVAADAGVAMPETYAEGPASELSARALPAPSVVKPRDPDLRPPLTTAVPVASEAELAALLAGLPPGFDVVVQERAPGPMLSLALVVGRDGAVIERFCERVVETWPIAAGRVSRSVSVAPDEELVDRVAALLHTAGYWGIAQVDLMGSARGPLLLDVNPRFYGCLPNALRCGAELPTRLHAVACDDPPAPRRLAYPAGVTYRWLEADLSAAFMAGDWGRLRRRTPAPRVGAMWSARDPVPAALLAARAAWVRARRRLPGGGA